MGATRRGRPAEESEVVRRRDIAYVAAAEKSDGESMLLADGE